MSRTESDLRLSALLGAETSALHRSAERTRTMGLLLRGSLPRASYVLLLRNLHAVYHRLEEALSRTASANRPTLQWLLHPHLPRAAAMGRDLTWLHGPIWRQDVTVLASTLEYVETIESAERTWPLGLAAHAWVRYMGDLSGGQILSRLVARHYDLDPPRGVRAYVFQGDAEELKASFRRKLDQIPVPDHAPMVEEARKGFEHSIHMLDEVAEGLEPRD